MRAISINRSGPARVTADGTVTLLDFGIATLLDTAPTGELPATILSSFREG